MSVFLVYSPEDGQLTSLSESACDIHFFSSKNSSKMWGEEGLNFLNKLCQHINFRRELQVSLPPTDNIPKICNNISIRQIWPIIFPKYTIISQSGRSPTSRWTAWTGVRTSWVFLRPLLSIRDWGSSLSRNWIFCEAKKFNPIWGITLSKHEKC